jgi:hypothetical protein
MLSKAKASEYLGCSVGELEKWVKPDRVDDSGNPATMGMRLWSEATLDAAKPHIEAWRARDKAATEARAGEFAAQLAAIAQKRKGMRKAGAMLAGKVCEILGCTRTELDRWAGDGRLAPDGLIHLYGMGARKSLDARAWLPDTIETTKGQIEAWRAQDKSVKLARRQKLMNARQRVTTGPTYGPVPSSWSGTVSRDANAAATTYVFRFGNRNLWKIGHAQNVPARLRDVNEHVPHEVLGERWSVAWRRRWRTQKEAYEMEQRLLSLLAARRTVGERVHCTEDELQAAWVGAVVLEPSAAK